MTSTRFQPTGQHLLADLRGIDPAKLSDLSLLEQLLLESAKAASATILSSHFHHFGSEMGVTGVVLLAESHISIHTWPESGFAAVDIFMCGKAEPQRALEVIQSQLSISSCTVQLIPRNNSSFTPAT